MTRARALLALTGLALLVTVPPTPTPIRAVVAVTFLLLAPGLAWVPRLPVQGPVETGTVAVALSLGLDTIVAEVLLGLGLPGLFPAALVLAGLTILGVAFTLRPAAAAA